jgi:phage portal protein BeeE
LKVVESGVLTDRQLCNAFSSPSVLFNDPANSTYNNYTTALKSLYTDAVIPVNNKILADINKDWLSQWSLRDSKRYKWMLDTSSIEALQADQKEEADKDNVIMDGVTKILALPISQEGKIFLLMDSYGYSEESAKTITEPFNTITE